MSAALTGRARADAIARVFEAAGAVPVVLDHLLPAGALLDLYGEDIRARAYTTHDPDLGEMMLRPDFTVPIVERHMAEGGTPARYTYLGEVFRIPPQGSGRPRSYLQVGFELFDGGDPAQDDAEVFALFSRVLEGEAVRPVTGDMGILLAAVDSLETTERRRAALRRHLWRPRRFRALFDRFAGRVEPPANRAELMAAMSERGADALIAEAGPALGRRSADDVCRRLNWLAEDAAAAPIPGGQAEVLDAILSLRAAMPDAHVALSDMSIDLPGIGKAVDAMGRRMEAMAEAGIVVGKLPFEASFGRTNMEYYDGFVFGFVAEGRADLPPVASGGRYDALTDLLGQGRGVPAVGGVIRPELLGGGT